MFFVDYKQAIFECFYLRCDSNNVSFTIATKQALQKIKHLIISLFLA